MWFPFEFVSKRCVHTQREDVKGREEVWRASFRDNKEGPSKPGRVASNRAEKVRAERWVRYEPLSWPFFKPFKPVEVQRTHARLY